MATASGLYAFLLYREAQLALAASLSFDSSVARQLDPGIVRDPHPAVVLGQSILSDTVVARLVSQNSFAASPTIQDIGEFRTRVELTQPSAGLLRVRYHDPDPGQATVAANAVAKALAEWAPSAASAPVSAANIQPAPERGPKLAPPSAPAPQNSPAAEQSLAAALGKLQAQLSAADKQAGLESSLLSEHDRQKYLESQVRAAQLELDDLRNQFANSDSALGEQARLDAIQHALAAFWPSAAGLNTAGTSQAQLDYEREQLTRAIRVIELQQQATQRVEAANSTSVNPPSQPAVPLASRAQPVPAADATSPPASGAAANPLHLERMAGPPATVVWWPSALTGCCCGLLYWGLAFARFRSDPESDDLLDLPQPTARSANRLLNIDSAVLVDSRPKWIEADPAETSALKGSYFNIDPDSSSAPAPAPPLSTESIQNSTAIIVSESPPETARVPNHTVAAQTDSAADSDAAPRTPEQQNGVFHEQIGETVGHWDEEIHKLLSQTTVARMFEPQCAAEDTAAEGPVRDVGSPPPEPDRLTG